MSPSGVNLGAIFTLIYSVGVSRPWPLLSYVRHDQGDASGGVAAPGGLGPGGGGVRQERVLNFISLPVSEECVSDDGKRTGICLNVYECKIQQGVSHGKCALGFGVCCISKRPPRRCEPGLQCRCRHGQQKIPTPGRHL